MESALSIYIYFTKLNYQMLSIAHNIDMYLQKMYRFAKIKTCYYELYCYSF